MAPPRLTSRQREPIRARFSPSQVCPAISGSVGLKAGGETGRAHILIIAVAFLSIVLSWITVHTVFTLRYARLYYSAGGGIDWHARDLPDFGDFAYVALTLGMTFQVSDTDIISKPIRKAALRHAVLSYVFGVVILATTINVVASLLAK